MDLTLIYYLTKSSRTKKLFEFLAPLGKLSARIYNQCIFFARLCYDNNESLPTAETIGINCRCAESPYDFYTQLQSLSNDNFSIETVRLNYTPIQSFEGLKHTDKQLNGMPEFPKYLAINTDQNGNQVTSRSFATRIRTKAPKIHGYDPKSGERWDIITSDDIVSNSCQYYMIISSDKEIYLPIPRECVSRIVDKFNPNEVQLTFKQITPDKYRIGICYRKPIVDLGLDKSRILFLDRGQDNFVAGITNDPNLYPILLNGKEIVAINTRIQDKAKKQYEYDEIQSKPKQQPINVPKLFYARTTSKLTGYREMNKSRIARIQNTMDRLLDQGIIHDDVSTETRMVKRFRNQRQREIREILHRYEKFLLDYCARFNIGTIVIGENKGWKQNTKQNKGADGNRKFGKNATRAFQYIPFYLFEKDMEYLTKIDTMDLGKIEEEYTSQVDHLAGESLEFHPSNKIEGIKRNMSRTDAVGNKIKLRHLFRSRSGIVIHADINGAIGISRRYFQSFKMPEIDFTAHVASHTIFTPIRITYNMLRQPIDIFEQRHFSI